jgi:hypothetical protein
MFANTELTFARPAASRASKGIDRIALRRAAELAVAPGRSAEAGSGAAAQSGDATAIAKIQNMLIRIADLDQ